MIRRPPRSPLFPYTPLSRSARSARRAVLGHYARALADLTARLSVSERLAAMSPELRASLERDRQELPGVWEQNRRRNADEPLRLKVSFMRARVEADPPGDASPEDRKSVG